MQMLIIKFSNERLIAPSGLSLVGQMLGSRIVSYGWRDTLRDP